jgi:hypothetical protein
MVVSSKQATITGFEWVGDQDTVPDPAADYDGLQAVAASVSSGFSTTQAREDRNGDRVVADANCHRCGSPYDGSGVCEECRTQGDVLDDHGLRTIGGGESR